MKKVFTGALLGGIIGTIDIIPMIIQKLTWDANISAFTMWLVIGILLPFINLNVGGLFKGLIVSLLIVTPTAVLIGWNEPMSLIPVFGMTTILGSILGFVEDKIIREE